MTICFEVAEVLHCTSLVSHTRASCNDIDSFRLWIVDPLEREHGIIMCSAQPVLRLKLHHALWWIALQWKVSQEVLEAKAGLGAELIGVPSSTVKRAKPDCVQPMFKRSDLVRANFWSQNSLNHIHQRLAADKWASLRAF